MRGGGVGTVGREGNRLKEERWERRGTGVEERQKKGW